MGFAEAVRTCFRNYVTFSGRASRPEYWWFILFILLGTIVGSILDGIFFGFDEPGRMGGHQQTRIFEPLFQLATFLPLLAVGWRRLHDTGRPGWYLILPLLATLGLALLVGGGMGAMMLGRGPSDAFEMIPAVAALGAGGMILLLLVQIVLFVLLIWWLTRPTQPGPNEYGPEPPAR